MNTTQKALADGHSLAPFYPKGVRWDLDIPQIDLTRVLDEAIVKFSDRPVIDFMGKKITYIELGHLIAKAAKGLQDMGVKSGSKVGLYMPNTPYYPIMFFAALRLGATVVNFSPLYTKEELRAQIRDSGTDVMVTLDLKDFQQKARALLDEGELKNIISCNLAGMLPPIKAFAYTFFKHHDIAPLSNDNRNKNFYDLIQNDGYYKPITVDPQSIAVLQYTGGTTGVPKGAILSHYNLVANSCQIEEFYMASPNKPNELGILRPGKERVLAAIPYFHVFGMTVSMIASMKLGGELIILPNPRDLDQAMKAIHKKKPTFFPAVPRLLQALAESPKAKHYDFSSLNSVFSGGAALQPNIRDNFEKAVGRAGIIKQGYGLTETSPVASSNPAYGMNKPESVGLSYPRTMIKIAHPDDPEQTLNIGDVGEILIKGPQVMGGYYNKPSETAEVLTQDGWFRTGDLGKLDENYYLHIVDRKKRLIIINGFNVYPNVVEQALSKHPSVAECVVISIPDERSGEAAKAFIRYKAGESAPTDAEWRSFLTDKLNRIEMPKHIETIEQEILKTAVGKPDWKKIQDAERIKYEQKKNSNQPKPPAA